MRTYETPRLEPHGSIHSITGFTGISQNLDFAWGPTGEIISDVDDRGSVSYCQQPGGALVPCEGPPQV